MKFVRYYILGWALAPVLAAYGMIALLSGRTYLPGQHGESHTLGGHGGLALAMAYLSGGVYLFVRFVLDQRKKSKAGEAVFYLAENALLILFIAAMMYVLIRMDTVQ